MARLRRWRGWLAAALSFSAFFVFPAIPIGHTGALTIPFALAAALAAAWIFRLAPAEWWPFAWIVAPAAISGAWVVMAGAALAPDVVPKSIVALAMSLLVIVPARRLLREGHGDRFLLGAALAIVVHAAIGLWQVAAFDQGVFPLAEVMRTNPAMSLLTEDIPTYVEYVKRPFGLFAEPSAMAACIGPWLVLVAAALFGRPRGGLARKALLALALAGGTTLVVLSKTGLAVPVVAGAAVAALASAFAWRRSTATRAAAVLAAALVALGSVRWLSENASARFALDRNDSWQARLESLKLGARWIGASVDSGGRFLLGVGPGQSYPAVQSTFLKYEAGGGVQAVWSVAVDYAMETGLLGMIAMAVLGALCARSIWRSPARVAGAMFALTWLSGLAVGTSYVGQPALWTGLAALLTWGALARRAI